MPVEAAGDSLRDAFGDDVVVVGPSAHRDPRGRLIELDAGDLPFDVRRVFTIGDVPAGSTSASDGAPPNVAGPLPDLE